MKTAAPQFGPTSRERHTPVAFEHVGDRVAVNTEAVGKLLLVQASTLLYAQHPHHIRECFNFC